MASGRGPSAHGAELNVLPPVSEPGPQCPSCGTCYPRVPPEPGVSYECSVCDSPLEERYSPDVLDSLSLSRRAYLYARADLPLGPPLQRTFGHFVLQEEIGRGGMGVVYHAWDSDRAKHIALKILLSAEHSSPEHLERFAREARAASRVSHPNLVKVHDIGWVDDRAYCTMDLVDGPTVLEILRRRDSMRVDEALRIAAGVARGLAAAHALGLVHRDVKPANVVLSPDGTPRLTDFGLAAAPDEGGRLTRTGQLMGTPAYMAPEQILSTRRVTARTDIYALGAVLYEMLTGQAPYPGDEPGQVMTAVAHGPPTRIGIVKPDLPRPVCLVVEKAMARDPDRRYADATAFADDLERCRRGEPVLARPPSLGDRLLRGWRDHRSTLVLVLVAFCCALVLLLLAWTGLQARQMQNRRKLEADADQRLAAVEEQVAEHRAEGRHADAARILENFADEPLWADTEAAVRARVHRATLLAELGRTEETVEAWAEVYVSARDPVHQDSALRGLAQLFSDSWRWEALQSVVDLLIERSSGSRIDVQVARWRAQSSLALRDLVVAADALEAADLPNHELVRTLAQTRDMPELEGNTRAVDTDGDGRTELWSADTEGGVVRSEADRAHRYHLPAPPVSGAEVFAIAWDPPLILARHAGGEAVLYSTVGSDGSVAPLLRWPEDQILSAVSGDVDGDGAAEVWVGIGPYGRRLLTLAPGPGGWRVTRRAPSVDAAESDVDALAVVDMDQDGRSELVAAVGPWGAYDVRVLAPDARGLPAGRAGSLRTVTRTKLGHVAGLTPAGHRVWANKTAAHPSRVVFPADRPNGEPPGAYLLAFDGSALHVERFLPSPVPSGGAADSGEVLLADLDGNGVDDVIWANRGAEGPATIIWVDGDRGIPPIVIGGMVPRGGLQADGDAADELVVQLFPEDRLVLLGDGPGVVTPLPPRRGLPQPDSLPDPETSPEARLANRAEELVSIGLVEEAVQELTRLAHATSSPELARQARRRAAVLSEQLGDDLRASELYTALGDPVSLDAAARNDLRGHRLAQALRAWRHLPVGPPDGLGALVAATSTVRWTFDEPLAPAFDILDPVAVRMDPHTHTLTVAAMADDGDLLRIPFTWSGDRIGLNVEFDVTHLEWSGGVEVALVGPQDEIAVQVSGWGGGRMIERQVGCRTNLGAGWTEQERWDPTRPAPTLSLAIDVSRLPGDARCRVREGDRHEAVNLPVDRLPTGGRWELRVRPSRHGTVQVPALARIGLRSLSLTATHLTVTPPEGSDVAWRRALAEGTLLEPMEPADEVQRALALISAERLDEARQALRGIELTPEVIRELRQALRTRLPTFGPLLQEALGRTYLEVFLGAYEVPMYSGPDQPDLWMAMTTGLPALEHFTPQSEAERERVGALLTARGRAWEALGQPEASLRDLLAAVRLADPSVRSRPGGWPTSARIALAAHRAAEGQAEEALTIVREAIARSAAPEITADMVRATPELQTLATRPEWAASLP